MTELNPSSRLKVKRDTFFLPDQEGGVYFRNNSSSFRMEGKTIYEWIEKLLPMFNGEQSMGDLTSGLTPPYRNRIYEIGETLYKNGFVRDASKDIPHQLQESVLERYASQIEFIENFTESGAYRFQEFRQARVLAVGSGPFMVSLAAALLQTGLPKINLLITEAVPTNRQRLNEFVEIARKTDADVELTEVPFYKGDGERFWEEAVRSYDWILYVSEDGNVNEARELNRICKQEKKNFFPAICLGKTGLAGPLTEPGSEGCFESAWRRLQQSALKEGNDAYSSTAGAILANVAVFEVFKKAAGIAGPDQSRQIYLLDFDTLEGDWLSFIPHPFVSSHPIAPRLIENLESRLKQESSRSEHDGRLLDYFSQLTSKDIGIFHCWEEQNLPQLPLSQCLMQAVDPLSEGPAGVLPEVICSGLTHEESRRNAGLKGIEQYVTRIAECYRYKNQQPHTGWNLPEGFIGIGSGETFAEAVCRGLEAWLEHEMEKRKKEPQKTVFRVPIGPIEDKRCRFYLNALTTLSGSPAIGLTEEAAGFPVVWVRSNGRWYTGAGLNATLALRNALQQALLDAQNEFHMQERQEKGSMIYLEKREAQLCIPSCDETTKGDLLHSSLLTLRKNGKQLLIYDFSFEPFLNEGLAGVYGVQVREEALK